jgi:hypothetical protein
MSSKFNAGAGRFTDAATGRFISFQSELSIQLRLERITKAVEKAKAGSLPAVGYLISTLAKQKIQRSKTPSQPGTPPATRKGLLKKAIRYAVASDKQSVVIGPTASLVGKAGMAHEFGGKYRGQKFPERSFMGPSLDEALPRIGPAFRGSVHS